ncbi:GTPase activating protein and VPS9 domains 1 [Dermatophagoides pteronyssinus]|uniref:GTPase activating protein and VPS9 domains 1 n=1 Tax=Dermatophagoides pteronyssinus TaxID=6956 RepID=UPI003F669FB5
MDLVQLIEKVRHQYVHIQDERQFIHKLNNDVNDEIDSMIRTMWIIKNQRYICDKLHESHQLNNNINDPINLINESNKIQQSEFIEGYKKFGSNESLLSQLLQHLRDNPKSISYLLFYAEKECSNFLDLLCKIIISTVYNHCFLDHDKLSLIDMMEELIEIYINFYDDLRRHMHSKNSSFGIVYRNFCDEQSELKTFYRLALTKPIMLVLSEDSLFLDIDSNRAVMRFCQEERQKHFGSENSPEYEENLNKYKKWTIQKMKYFVNNFIRSLKENIYAFPQSLIWLMVRMYTKLIERFDYQKVNSIFVDMIFFYLICPAIQNPDLFGITDLHINHIAHYNLMQCAQIIQMLALSNWEKVSGPYQQVCSLFDRNCLSFIMEHIFIVAKNSTDSISQQQQQRRSSTSIESIELPYFLCSDIELKFLLEYIGLFLQRNDQPDQPLNTYYRQLPQSILNFDYDDGKVNSLKSERSIRKSKSISDYIDSLDEFSSLNIKHLLANNGDNLPTLKCLFNSKQIFKITNQNFSQRFIGMKNEEKILGNIIDRQIILNETVDRIREEIDKLFNLEIDNFPCSPIINDTSIDKTNNNLASLLRSNDDDDDNDQSINEIENDPINQSFDDTFDDEINMQSLGTLTLQLGDLVDLDITSNEMDRNRNHSPELNESNSNKSSSGNPVGKKVISSFKNIKDKMKNISLSKDNKQQQQQRTSLIDLSKTNNNVQIGNQSIIADRTEIKAETDKIFDKYRSTTTTTKQLQQSMENENISNQQRYSPDLIILNNNDVENSIVDIDFLGDIHLKIYKLISLIDLFHVYRRYKFLNLSNKNDFILFLKILLSESNDMNEISTSVLIMDIIRIVQDIDQEELSNIFQKIEIDWKTRNFYIIYLLKSRQYLLQRLKQIDSVQQSLHKDHSSTDFIIISFLVRSILEKQEQNIQELIRKFRDSTTLTDEKASLVQRLLDHTIDQLQTKLFTDEQLTLLRQILERHLMNRIYLLAFYPNGDIDQLRDQILHQQINQLSLNLSHNSKLLNIPTKFFTTSPWPSAQAELLLLSAYKTPRDKIQCIYRCCSHIMTLLSTSQNSIPSADDLLPVLIFVVIKSNTRSILSTIEYINTFYLNEMTGEQSYYWTQFCSAVEFIKTILHCNP